MREQRPDIFISEAVDAFMRAVMEVLPGGEILMALLYGSAAYGTFLSRLSPVRILLVLDGSLEERLAAFPTRVSLIMQKYRIEATVLTETEFLDPAGQLCCEYADMKAVGRLLHGEDLLDRVKTDPGTCTERFIDRLRQSIISLRQLALQSEGRRRALADRFGRWCEKQPALHRGLLYRKDPGLVGTLMEMPQAEQLLLLESQYALDRGGLDGIYEFLDRPAPGTIDTGQLMGLHTAYSRLLEALRQEGS